MIQAIQARKGRMAKSGKSARSQFYSQLMRELAGTIGEEIATAFVGQDAEKFSKLWDRLSKRLLSRARGDGDYG